ncbi:NUDIX hydrolase [Deinococcus altitudinis]|uniref:NUDIX hydrolase n=1 Tax=Deinococcus altitudinis TaxID=468914 RepID=UPI003891A701
MNPAARLRERVLWQGVEVERTWAAGTSLSTGLPVLQVSGIWLNEGGEIVLVSEPGGEWNLPGGHPQGREIPEKTLTRELAEEACAEMLTCRLLGWQRVDDPREPPYVQLRYVAQGQLREFQPAHEIRHRRLVSPQDFLSALSWGRSPIAAGLLRVALEAKLP